MPVSRRDRSFFARLGEFKAASHALAAIDHLAQPLAERLARSWALFENFPQRATAPRDPVDSLAFYARARALGLYRR